MQVHQRRRPIVEINMIPLIDVSLILVIIFMVLTPVLMQSQITVKLPKSTEGTPPPSESVVQVEISRAGVFTVDGSPVKLLDFEHEMTLRLSGAAKKNVLVQADKTVPVERVVFVLDVAKRLGVQKLGIGVSAAEK